MKQWKKTEQSGNQMLKWRLNGECWGPIGHAVGQGSLYQLAAGITQMTHLLTYSNPHLFGTRPGKNPTAVAAGHALNVMLTSIIKCIIKCYFAFHFRPDSIIVAFPLVSQRVA